MTFVVEEREIHAHRCVLVARSEYFAGMLCGQALEASLDRITLNDIRAEVFELLIRYLYLGSVASSLEPQLLFELTVLANEFLLPELVRSFAVETTLNVV